MSSMNADYWIQVLALERHPEGGYFRETYRGNEKITGLPERYSGTRNPSTSMYYLLKGSEFSAFHRIKSDEVWHFYEGYPIKLFIINREGTFSEHILGRDAGAGQVFQWVIPHDEWFAAKPLDKEGFSLVGCDVSPGFEFEDFELANRRELIHEFPLHKDVIIRFTSGYK